MFESFDANGVGYLAAGFTALCVWWIWTLRAKLPKACSEGLQVSPSWVPFWGVTLDQIRCIIQNKEESIAAYHLRMMRECSWTAFGDGHLGGVLNIQICDPRDVQFVMKDAFNSFVKAPTFITIMQDFIGNGIINSNGSSWKSQRIALSGMFSKRKLREKMGTVFGDHSQYLAHCFGRYASMGTAVDAQKLFFCFTFDCANRISLNKEANSLRGDEEDIAFQTAFDSVQRLVTLRFFHPWWKVQRCLNVGGEKELADALAKVNSCIDGVLRQYITEDGHVSEEAIVGDGSLVALLLEHGIEEGSPLTKQYLRDMILVSLIGSRDTTGSALTSCVSFLCRNPEWQEKLRIEALAVFGGNIQEALTFDDIEGKSPLTEAVFMESIRLQPPVPLNEKIATADVTLPSGTKVYEGEHVGFGPGVMGQNPNVWGEDCTEWKPERWLGGKDKQYDDFMFLTFNCGPRLCLGKNMAILEAKIALLTLMAQYSFTMEPGFTPETDISMTWNLTQGLNVRVHAHDIV